MQTLIPNTWNTNEDGVSVANILRHDTHPEGLDFDRARFARSTEYQLPRDEGALLSVLAGALTLSTSERADLCLGAGAHCYLPPNSSARLRGEAGTEILYACAPSAERARGSRFLLRDDQFLQGCALPGKSFRWILTPQYLSRRVFLHHDPTLASPVGEPVSWFHTTMFDAHGLPTNDEGRPVFKMSYNYRTEPNVCYDVKGNARVRMALHPYQNEGQQWGPWHSLSGETTYHLCEDASVSEWADTDLGPRPRRNKHEVQIEAGYVSLMCMHCPACTGVERHSTGAYSEYGDLKEVLGTPDHLRHLEQIAPFDEMVDALSLAKAGGANLQALPQWRLYQDGLSAQREIEAALLGDLQVQGHGREGILAPWTLPGG